MTNHINSSIYKLRSSFLLVAAPPCFNAHEKMLLKVDRVFNLHLNSWRIKNQKLNIVQYLQNTIMTWLQLSGDLNLGLKIFLNSAFAKA